MPDPAIRDIRIQRPIGHHAVKRERANAKLKVWRAVCRLVLARDAHTCRVCRVRSRQVDPHHIVFKSAGGLDTTANVAAVCRICHDEIHAGRIFVSGNADKRLRIERV